LESENEFLRAASVAISAEQHKSGFYYRIRNDIINTVLYEDQTADIHFMRQALTLAAKGEGFVEPNPMVGCVIVKNGEVIGSGYHTRYGAAHAEIEALRNAAARRPETDLAGATCYVTLEPCSHYGKTPPCAEAVINSGIRRVVAATGDPNPLVSGKGFALLRQAGISVTENVLREEAEYLNAPYLMRLTQNRPWVHAKWAMTLDGRLASKTRSSQWISGEEARKTVHQLRSRMDAVITGIGTVINDDPLLTVRLSEPDRIGSKTPLRIVMDSGGSVSPDCRLVQTAKEVPVLIVTKKELPPEKDKTLKESGCEILRLPGDHADQCRLLLQNLAERKMTNVLLEGGCGLFGTFFDLSCIDEIHAFVSPKLIGGSSAVPVIGGDGIAAMPLAVRLAAPEVRLLGEDIYVHGRLR
jgi:diaminohydroxyphosphoribosylaminopyrimidine deaminase/5-amino-6-(5-phosphoribosylamino)uracil reductase